MTSRFAPTKHQLKVGLGLTSSFEPEAEPNSVVVISFDKRAAAPPPGAPDDGLMRA